jgi:hypothetical protein
MNRLKRFLKVAGIGAAIVLVIALLLNALFGWSASIRLKNRLATLRNAGEPVQLSDLARKPIPPEKNAEEFLRRVSADLDATQKALEVWYPRSGFPTAALTADDQQKLDKLFAAHSTLVPLLEQAADCPDCVPEVDFTLPTMAFLKPYIDYISKHRPTVRMLRARAALRLSQRRRDDALATHVLTLKLARHWLRDPLIQGYLNATACEMSAMDGVNQVLQSGPISPAARQALDTELALHDSMDGYNWALRSERSYSLSSMRELRGSLAWLTRGFVNDTMVRLVDLYDGYLEAGARPYAETAAARKGPSSRRGVLNPYTALVTLLEPGLAAVRAPAERTRAMSRCLRVQSALQRRAESASDGDTVPRLSDLGLPESVTIDPFNSKALQVKKLPGGWLVYSVGADLVDDGGKLEKYADVGAGPATESESRAKR